MPLQQKPADEWPHRDAVLRLGEQARLSVGDPVPTVNAMPQATPILRGRTGWRGFLSFCLVGVSMVAVLSGVILLVDQYSPPDVQPPSPAALHDTELERQRAGIEARIEALQKAGAARAAVARLGAPLAEPTPVALPDGVIPRVVLRYTLNSTAARTRALAFELTLRAFGLEVADPVAAPAGTGGNSVGYFYTDDQPSAGRIASDLALPEAVQRRLPAKGALPRPGTVDIAITG